MFFTYGLHFCFDHAWSRVVTLCHALSWVVNLGQFCHVSLLLMLDNTCSLFLTVCHAWPRIVTLANIFTVVKLLVDVSSLMFVLSHGWSRLITQCHASPKYFTGCYASSVPCLLGCSLHVVTRSHALSRVNLNGHSLPISHVCCILIAAMRTWNLTSCCPYWWGETCVSGLQPPTGLLFICQVTCALRAMVEW
jgi:hypothetical protein